MALHPLLTVILSQAMCFWMLTHVSYSGLARILTEGNSFPKKSTSSTGFRETIGYAAPGLSNSFYSPGLFKIVYTHQNADIS
jgi:hypothetical protein